jgi:Xaa-Pro dipeptidase
MSDRKVKRIFANLDREVDMIILKNATAPHVDLSFFYVTGLTTGLFEGSCALLYPDGKLEVVTSPLEEESARKGSFRVTVFKNRDKAVKIMENRLRNAKRIGINNEELTYQEFLRMKKCSPGARFFDISPAIRKTRVVKDGVELDRIRKSCAIASAVAEKIPGMLEIGVTEKEVGAEISYSMRKCGAEEDAFTTICAFGPNSAEPHYSVGERKLRKGDFVVADFGARYQKYCSDITRTFLAGKPTKKHKEIYDLVLRMQETALDHIRAGVEGREVQEAVENIISKTKYRGRFTHGIGHSLGLATHDGCGFTYPPDLILEENMVLTVEPGIYIPGFGGVRIEDDIVVRKNGYELLTHADRALIHV